MMSAEIDKENRKGKSKMAGAESVDDGEDDEDSDADDDANDMQLAWEMLELAKLCYGSHAAEHAQELAGG